MPAELMSGLGKRHFQIYGLLNRATAYDKHLPSEDGCSTGRGQGHKNGAHTKSQTPSAVRQERREEKGKKSIKEEN